MSTDHGCNARNVRGMTNEQTFRKQALANNRINSLDSYWIRSKDTRLYHDNVCRWCGVADCSQRMTLYWILVELVSETSIL
jgi:hypothetical protein